MTQEQHALDIVTETQGLCDRLERAVREGERPTDVLNLVYQLVPVGFSLPPGMYRQWAAFSITRTLWRIGRKDEAQAMMLTVIDEGFLLKLQEDCPGMF
jgi:hypothetical protein